MLTPRPVSSGQNARGLVDGEHGYVACLCWRVDESSERIDCDFLGNHPVGTVAGVVVVRAPVVESMVYIEMVDRLEALDKVGHVANLPRGSTTISRSCRFVDMYIRFRWLPEPLP